MSLLSNLSKVFAINSELFAIVQVSPSDSFGGNSDLS